MDHSKLLELVTELGYRLAVSGAETYRIEESINRITDAYGIKSEVFSIPNCLITEIKAPGCPPLTQMRRIGIHGNDLEAVEQYSNLSRRICGEKPTLDEAQSWLAETERGCRSYGVPMYLLGNFLGAFGFCFLFGGGIPDMLCAGSCGILVGLLSRWMERLGANHFFRIIFSSSAMALTAYALGCAGIAPNPDTVIIGSSMLLVPGLLFTNAMRDIIHGDTNSGINRVIQVILIAMALAIGCGAAWHLAVYLWGNIPCVENIQYSWWLQALSCALGCLGFSILFNIHGSQFCILGGAITWLLYLLAPKPAGSDYMAYFIATLFAAVYSEVMARVRKFPAISYLVVSIFPLLPGAGIYLAVNFAVRNQSVLFAQQCIHTAAVAGIMAVAILLGSTCTRLFYRHWKKGPAKVTKR